MPQPPQPVGNFNAWVELRRWTAGAAGATATAAAAAFVLGKSGTGKTTAVAAVLAEYDKTPIHLNSHTCENARDLRDKLGKAAASSRILDQIEGASRDYVIVLDELDTMIQIDRLVLSTLADFLTGAAAAAGGRPPIIMIGSPDIERKLSAYKAVLRTSAFIRFYPIDEASIFEFLKGQAAAQATTRQLMEIAERCEGSLTAAVRELSAAAAAAQAQATPDRPLEFGEIYTATDVAAVARYLAEDPWLNPLRLHENMPRHLTSVADYDKFLTTFSYWEQCMQREQEGLAAELLARCLVAISATQATAATAAVPEFTKLFSQMSLQRKQERALYRSAPGDFPHYLLAGWD